MPRTGTTLRTERVPAVGRGYGVGGGRGRGRRSLRRTIPCRRTVEPHRTASQADRRTGSTVSTLDAVVTRTRQTLAAVHRRRWSDCGRFRKVLCRTNAAQVEARKEASPIGQRQPENRSVVFDCPRQGTTLHDMRTHDPNTPRTIGNAKNVLRAMVKRRDRRQRL